MSTPTGTVTVWQSGRLAPRIVARRSESSPRRWLVAALLVLSAVVLGLFVGVLREDVDRSQLQHAARRSRAVDEARCEADQPAELRGRCIALFDGAAVPTGAVPEVVPGNAPNEQHRAAGAMAVSLLSAR